MDKLRKDVLDWMSDNEPKSGKDVPEYIERLKVKIEEVKKNSSKWIKTKDKKYQTFSWQAGYGNFSIGQSGIPSTKKYIADQGEHHRKRTFKEEYIGFLKKYKIDYDERYVWE